jgi:hypothetical protein
VLHESIRLIVTNEEIQDPVDHKNDVENKHKLHVFERDSLALDDQYWGQEDVEHENDLSAVVPLHIPVVVRADDEPRYLLVRTGLLCVLDFVAIVLLPFIHLLDLLTAQLRHHTDHLFLLSDC